MTAPLDEIDRRLLRELHRDSRLTTAELARRASLSRPPPRHVCAACRKPG